PLRPQVPQRVDQRGGGEMDHALVGTEPAQLALVGEAPMEAGEVGGDLLEVAADGEERQGVGCGADELVAPADGEAEPVTGDTRVALQNDVGGRVVGIGVHGVRAGQRARGGRADVEYAYAGDTGHGRGTWKLCVPPSICSAVPVV